MGNEGTFPFSTPFPVAYHRTGNLFGVAIRTVIDGQHVGEKTSHKKTNGLLDKASETGIGG